MRSSTLRFGLVCLCSCAWLIGSAARVVAAPSNDNFADALAIAGTAGTINGTTIDSTVESFEPNTAYFSQTVWYKWTAPATGSINFMVDSTDFPVFCNAFTGTSLGTLIRPINSNQGYTTMHYNVNIRADAGTTYYIQVEGYYIASGTFSLTWVPGPQNDFFIDLQTLTGSSFDVVGTTVNAAIEDKEPYISAGTVTKPSSSTVWYKWIAPGHVDARFTIRSKDHPCLIRVYTGSRADGTAGEPSELVPWQGATTGLHTMLFTYKTAVLQGMAIYIQVDGDNLTAGTFELEGGPIPDNDPFDHPTILDPTLGTNVGSLTASNIGASSENNEPLHAGRAGGNSVWFRWTAPVTETIAFNTIGSSIDTLLAVYTGTSVSALTPIASSDNDPRGMNGSSRVVFHAVAGTQYHIAVDGYAGAVGIFKLQWRPPVNVFCPDMNGQSEILFQNRTTGRLIYWSMSGTNFVRYGEMSPAHSEPGWTVIDTGDQYATGFGSILLQRPLTGEIGFASLTGARVSQINSAGQTGSPDWRPVSCCYINRDALADVIFQNQTTGDLYCWTYNTSNGWISPRNPGPDWVVVGTADLNGDDKPDIVLQNSKTYELIYWLMDGTQRIAYGSLSPSQPGAGWWAVSFPDFNGDGEPDILFQNQVTGKLAYWLMDGVRETKIGTLPDPGGAVWRVVSSH